MVVDDAAQGVTDVVRGADLLSSTARQRLLGRLLDLPLPRYMHVPLILDADSGLKLSKQNGAPAIDTNAPLAALGAWRALGFESINGAADPACSGAGHGAMGAPFSASGRLSSRHGRLYSGCRSAPSIRTSSASPFSPTRNSPNRATS